MTGRSGYRPPTLSAEEYARLNAALDALNTFEGIA